jgi:hypothetical protein
MEAQACYPDANKQDCLTPVAVEDDYPTPRFDASAACESPVSSFGNLPGTIGKGSDTISHHETCQYVIDSRCFHHSLAPHRSDHGEKSFTRPYPGIGQPTLGPNE